MMASKVNKENFRENASDYFENLNERKRSQKPEIVFGMAVAEEINRIQNKCIKLVKRNVWNMIHKAVLDNIDIEDEDTL